MEDLKRRFPDSQLTYQLNRLARMLQAEFMDSISATGLSSAQANLMREISSTEPLSQTDIAQRMQIKKASVGEMLDRLAQDGFIARVRSSADRRIMGVRLTDKGEDAIEQLARSAEAQLDRIKRRIGDRDSAELARLIRAVCDSMDQQIAPGLSD